MDYSYNLIRQKQKFEAYYYLQLCDLQVLLMNLLILHLQNVFETLQVLLNVFVRSQRVLTREENSEGDRHSLKHLE